MEQIVGKLVARVCYVTKKILEEIQESENCELSNNIEEKFSMCHTDTSKTIQICSPMRSQPTGAKIYNAVKQFESLLGAFEKDCSSFCHNRFDFQLRQSIQSSQKELCTQLNVILSLLETKNSQEKPSASPKQKEKGIGDCGRNVAINIRKLSDEALKGDVENFIKTAKHSFVLMKELQQVLMNDGSEEANTLAQKIGKLSLMVIRAGKEVCQHPGDKTRQDFSLAKQAIAQQLQQVLFFSKNKDSPPITSLPVAPSSPALTEVTTTPITVNEQNISKLKHQMALKIEKQLAQKANQTNISSESPSESPDKKISPKRKTQEKSPRNVSNYKGTNIHNETNSEENSSVEKATESSKNKSPVVGRLTRSISTKRRSSSGLLRGKLKPMKGKAVKDAIQNLQDKPLFLLHKSQDSAVSPPLKLSSSCPIPKDINRAQTLRLDLPEDMPYYSTPLSSHRNKINQSWKDSLAKQVQEEKLDSIITLLEVHMPQLAAEWKNIPAAMKNNLRDQVEDKFLRTELQERLQIPTGSTVGPLEGVTKASIAFVSSMFNCLQNLDEEFLPERETNLKRDYDAFLESLILTTEPCGSVFQILSEVSESTIQILQDLKNSDFDAQNEYFVKAASQSGYSFHTPVKEMLAHQSNGVYIIITQLLGLLKLMRNNGKANELRLISLMSTIRSLSSALSELVLHFQTGKAIAIRKKEQSKGLTILEGEDLDELVDIDIWVNADDDSSTTSLNSIVRRLTKEYDNSLMKTVIYTYRSFTSPEQLLSKLIRRFHVPPYIEHKEALSIQLRVCVVLKYWIQNQFHDFDNLLIEELQKFIKVIRSAGHTQMADGITSQLAERLEERALKGTEFQLRPVHLRFPEVTSTSIEYFMSFPVEEVAKQITMIDSLLLSHIQPSELMHQSWTNKKTKHQSMNVCWCMDRLNMISYWVPTVILSFSTIAKRKEIVEWFYSLSLELHKMHNYQSLMAIVAGFNNASVQRLKHTFEFIDKDLTKKYKLMEELMSPQGSFKNYRNAIKKAHLPAVPFLGVYLSDLVFIDEGNQDETEEKGINFEKRKLVYATVEDLQLYQSLSFEFPILQPLNQFLSWIPSLNDSQLYKLSLQREPRGSTREDIN